jgi:O-antigen ligase
MRVGAGSAGALFLPLILTVGFLLQGAKTPLAAFVSASFLAVFLARELISNPNLFSWSKNRWEWLCIVLLILSWGQSTDRSLSTFESAGGIIFVLLWILLKNAPNYLNEEALLWTTLRVLAILTMGKTAIQFLAGDWRQAYGFFPINPTLNAAWMASLAVAFLAYSLPALQKRRLDLGIALGLFFFTVTGPSRIVLVALGFGAVYVFYPWFTARRVATALTLLTIGFLLVPKDLVYKRVRLNEGNYRRQIWTVAVKAANEKPFFGWGLGTFESAYQRYAFPVETDRIRFARTTRFAHNEYLQAAAEIGWPMAGILFLFLWKMALRIRRVQAPHHRAVAAALIVLCICAGFTHIWHLPYLLLWTIVCGAALVHPRA